MKFNLKLVKNVALKYKFILLSILVITIFFIYFIKPIREGLTGLTSIGEYQYLAPLPSGSTWSPTTISQFVTKYNNVNNLTGKSAMTTDGAPTMSFWALEEEAQYYIQNGNFPYDSYVANYLTQNPNVFHNFANIIPATISNVAQILSNRAAFELYMARYESDPPTLAYQIYRGTAQPPPLSSSPSLSSLTSPFTSSPSLSSLTSPFTSSSSPSNTLSGTNYQQLVSLCKNVVGNN
jgi:hypothetical protein